VPAFARNEFAEDDVNKLAVLARQAVPVGILSRATDGHPERSRRYREILHPVGLEAELRAAYRADSFIWGVSTLYRERGGPDFQPDEAAFVAEVAGLLGEGFRRTLIASEMATGTGSGGGPGLVILSEDGSIEAITPDAERWIEELDNPLQPATEAVPTVILHVAGRARAIAAGTLPPAAGPARARVLTSSGHWLLVHANTLEGRLPGRTAVILEAARPVEIAPLIVAAYGLSERERQITELVLQGASTSEMASRLHLSSYTVQDRLKAIFDKMSVSSRREVASRIFFDHHFPPKMWQDDWGGHRFLTERPG
jgi:DNA-binding CsgD family transcriptional regulator